MSLMRTFIVHLDCDFSWLWIESEIVISGLSLRSLLVVNLTFTYLKCTKCTVCAEERCVNVTLHLQTFSRLWNQVISFKTVSTSFSQCVTCCRNSFKTVSSSRDTECCGVVKTVVVELLLIVCADEFVNFTIQGGHKKRRQSCWFTKYATDKYVTFYLFSVTSDNSLYHTL